MYILHKGAVRPLRAIATLVVMALVMWTLGIMPFQNRADAANLIQLSDTLSDSDLGVASNHTFSFTTPTGAVTGQTVVINFPVSTFTVNGTGATGLDFNDMDVTVGSSSITLGSSPSGTTWGVATTTTSITFTTSSTSGATIGSSTLVVIRIGTNATVGATGDTRITNPASAGSVELTVNGSMPDNGQTRVAIIDDVVVTADVNTSFTFTITGVANGQNVNGSATTTGTTTTATSVPFGTLTAGSSTVLAQDLAVSTNAANGFVVTVEQSQNLLSSTGADIDGFRDGSYLNSPGAWSGPLNTLGSEATYGHWAITSEDDLNLNEFGADLWVAASTTPRQVFHHNSVANGIAPNIGSTRIGYQAGIGALQEAADDYTTTLTFIATPTF